MLWPPAFCSGEFENCPVTGDSHEVEEGPARCSAPPLKPVPGFSAEEYTYGFFPDGDGCGSWGRPRLVSQVSHFAFASSLVSRNTFSRSGAGMQMVV